MKEKFSISGMSCAACSAGIERRISHLKGVEKVEVSLMGECMLVEYNEKELFEISFEKAEAVLKEKRAESISFLDTALQL